MEINIEYLKDAKGRIFRWPKKKAEKIEVLKYIKTKFEIGKQYTEKEVNELIMEWHTFGDYALIRREMYDNFLLERTPDGRRYWIENKEKEV
jgi:hypothetical protein